MFNLGFTEILLLCTLALIFIGPKQLPEVARVLGRFLNEIKRATGDVTESFVKTRNDSRQAIDNIQSDIEKSLTAEENKTSTENIEKENADG